MRLIPSYEYIVLPNQAFIDLYRIGSKSVDSLRLQSMIKHLPILLGSAFALKELSNKMNTKSKLKTIALSVGAALFSTQALAVGPEFIYTENGFEFEGYNTGGGNFYIQGPGTVVGFPGFSSDTANSNITLCPECADPGSQSFLNISQVSGDPFGITGFHLAGFSPPPNYNIIVTVYDSGNNVIYTDTVAVTGTGNFGGPYEPQYVSIAGVASGASYVRLLTDGGGSDAMAVANFSFVTVGGTVYALQNDTFSSLSVLGSATEKSNSPAFGAAGVIDSTPELLALFSSAGLSGDNEVSDAASQTLPLLTGSSTVAVTAALNGINRVVQSRMASNQGLSSGDGFTSDKYFWVKPFGSWTDQDDKAGVTGFDANTYGIAGGFDGLITDQYRLGAAFAYAKSDVDSNSSTAPQSLNTDVYQLVGYGTFNLDDQTSINFQVDVGHNSNKGQRTIAFTSTAADADYDSLSAHIGLGLSKIFAMDNGITFTPSLRTDYTWLKDDGYTETGAGALNLSVDKRSTTELLVGLHGQLSKHFDEHSILTANLGASYDLHNGPSSITSAFAGAPTAAFSTYGITPDPWRAHAGVGYVRTLENGTEINVRYDADYQDDYLNQTASVNMRWMF